MTENVTFSGATTATPAKDISEQSSAGLTPAIPPKDNGQNLEGSLIEKSGAFSAASTLKPNPVTTSNVVATTTSDTPSVPSIYKRKFRRSPKGILKPAPPPTKAFSFKRDILQQLNTRLAQQGVNVQVPVPSGPTTLGSFGGTAQGTAQAAGNLLGGMFRKMSGMVVPPTEDGLTSAMSRSGASSLDSRSNSRDGPSSSSKQNEELESVTRMNNLPAPSSSIRPLRRVRFPVSAMSVIYPISNALAPGDEDATRKRIEKEHREMLKKKQSKEWTVGELESLYRDCCRMREEHPLKKMRAVFTLASQQVPPGLRSIDLSFVPLDRHAIEPISDLLSINFGLKKLILENCGLADDGVKSILNSLLASGNLPSLSLASNRKIKYHGWRYVGIFMRRAKALKYLDLSENNINKASLEHIAGAIANAPKQKKNKQAEEAFRKDTHATTDTDEDDAPLTFQSELLKEESQDSISLSSLRLENCGLKSNSLEILAHSVRFSHLNHLSLRRNRISQVGAVALAVMIKDHPDNNPTNTSFSFGSIDHTAAIGHQQMPYVISSPGGGVTRRNLNNGNSTLSPTTSRDIDTEPSKVDQNNALTEEEREEIQELIYNERRNEEDAIALFHARRAKRVLSSMPRLGNLLTLDLKGNEIRGGVVYLGQALRKNRTLKVLNLSDNGIEVTGLVALADALKYNATLETLDLSHNPCCGPGLEGITTLRNAFTLNSNLKRLFISDTDLSSEGAIALAEFLPEARSLIHLDLTENLEIDIAGVMALAVSVRQNKSLRCLDLNIPPNAPDFARLSQEILNSCIRNTEIAQRRAQQRGVKAPIAAPIYKSTLARAAKEIEERNRLAETNIKLEQATRFEGGVIDVERNREKVVDAAQECCLALDELLSREEESKKELLKERDNSIQFFPQSELSADLLKQGRVVRDKLQRAMGVIAEGDRLTRALQVNEHLENVISKLDGMYKTRLREEEKTEGDEKGVTLPPPFSIGSDDADDNEEGTGLGEEGTINQAAREIPADDDEQTSKEQEEENDKVVEKARGQLSEEGEIFRRARTLHIDEEKDRDDDATSTNGNANQAREGEVEADPMVKSFSRARLDSSSSRIEEDVTGEELRELLESNVPMSSPLKRPTSLDQNDADSIQVEATITTE